MLIRICLCLALFAAIPVWSQVAPSATETGITTVDDTQMMTPHPVSGESYPITVGDEVRSNYLAAGVVFTSAYDDNVLAGEGTAPIRDLTYSIWPTVTLDQATSRQRRVLTYSPGFTFYQHTTALNATDQNAALSFLYRLSPHITANVQDAFQKSSNAFNQPYPLSGGGISGSTPSPTATVIVPFADRLGNTVNASISYQFSRNGMIGGGGDFEVLDFPNSSQVPGLYNSHSSGGSAFYSARLSKMQYIGVTYQYSRILAYPLNAESEAQTHSFLPFYTIYLNRTFSISVLAGPQHFNATQTHFPSSSAWTPTVMASVGWQRSRTNLVARYSHAVTGGGGLVGAYNSTSADAIARWQIAHTWTVGAEGIYANYKNVSALEASASPGGHAVSGTTSLQHPFNDHFMLEFGYDRLHQSYASIAVIASAPDSNRVFLSLTYRFAKPLGR